MPQLQLQENEEHGGMPRFVPGPRLGQGGEKGETPVRGAGVGDPAPGGAGWQDGLRQALLALKVHTGGQNTGRSWQSKK